MNFGVGLLPARSSPVRTGSEGDTDPELLAWIERFEQDKHEAALGFWYETHKGIHESLREF